MCDLFDSPSAELLHRAASETVVISHQLQPNFPFTRLPTATYRIALELGRDLFGLLAITPLPVHDCMLSHDQAAGANSFNPPPRRQTPSDHDRRQDSES